MLPQIKNLGAQFKIKFFAKCVDVRDDFFKNLILKFKARASNLIIFQYMLQINLMKYI